MKPGLKPILSGVALFLLGAVILPVLFIVPAIFTRSDEVRFKVPGSVEPAIEKPGRYYLWNEFRTFHNGKNYNRSESLPDGIEIHVQDSNGQSLEFVSDATISSSSKGRSKSSIGYVQVEKPGKLKIYVSGSNEERVFSFSQSEVLKMFGLILAGGVLSTVVTLAGVGLIVWGIVKFARTSRNLGTTAA